MALPLAHVGHYLWVLYILPVIIVIGGIVRTTLVERRRSREAGAESGRPDAKEGTSGGRGEPPGG